MSEGLTKHRTFAVEPARGLIIPKQGTFRKIIGGLALTASFFLPAISIDNTAYFPFKKGLLFQDLWLQSYLPILYLFGFTSALVALLGRFRGRGIPKILVVIHLVINTLTILGAGLVLHLALLNPRHDFGIVLIGPALLVWWPLFIQYTITWFSRQRPFIWKLARVNWIASFIAMTFFSMATASAAYDAKRGVMYGIILSTVACIFLVIGNIQNEERKTYAKLT